jgi:hypothetical protein
VRSNIHVFAVAQTNLAYIIDIKRAAVIVIILLRRIGGGRIGIGGSGGHFFI